MSEYDVTLTVESGLTDTAVEQMVRDAFPDAENVTVEQVDE